MTNLKLMDHHDFDQSETSAGSSITEKCERTEFLAMCNFNKCAFKNDSSYFTCRYIRLFKYSLLCKSNYHIKSSFLLSRISEFFGCNVHSNLVVCTNKVKMIPE